MKLTLTCTSLSWIPFFRDLHWWTYYSNTKPSESWVALAPFWTTVANGGDGEWSTQQQLLEGSTSASKWAVEEGHGQGGGGSW